jgi:hypothetical protein
MKFFSWLAVTLQVDKSFAEQRLITLSNSKSGLVINVCVLSLFIAVLFCANASTLILRVTSLCVKQNKQRKKAKTSAVGCAAYTLP